MVLLKALAPRPGTASRLMATAASLLVGLGCSGSGTEHTASGGSSSEQSVPGGSHSNLLGEGEPAAKQVLTYFEHAAPVLNRYCASCHVTGGLAPFPLDSYAGASRVSAVVAAVVENRRMPPLPADPTCRPLDDPRVMGDAERKLLIDWVAGGALEGNPAKAAPPLASPGNALGQPDHILDGGLDFVTEFQGTDEYRCFLVESPVEASIDAVAFAVTTTNLATLHHAFIDLVRPEDIEAVQALDGSDAAPGWSCFGGAGFDGVRVGGYVPGGQTHASPDGTGVPVPAGARFVLNVHYNYLTNRDPSRLGVQIWQAKAPLTGTPRRVRLIDRSFVVPAGEADASATTESAIVARARRRALTDALPGRAWGASGHMHMLGQSLRIDLLGADGSEECLLSIPAWDFHWQGDYRFVEPRQLVPGDTVRMTCRWDNSAENQPIVDGVQGPPQTVTWGEQSTDEMCLGSVLVTD